MQLQCNDIANHTNIFKLRYKKHRITSEIDKLFYFIFLFPSNYCSHGLFFFIEQAAEGGGASAPPPATAMAYSNSEVSQPKLTNIEFIRDVRK